VTQKLAQIRPMTQEEQAAMVAQAQEQQRRMQGGAAVAAAAVPAPTADAKPGFDEADRSTWGNPGRNDLCPCGSGKKFKHCHGALT
jgi:preprotein translocase subunit SecA